MRSWPLLVVFAAICGSACWTDRSPGRLTTPAPAAPADPTAGGPPSSGIRFVSRAPNRCAPAIAHVLEQSKADIAGSGMSEAFIQEMQEMAVASCQETQWSPETLACFEGTETSSELTACFKAMLQEQQDDFQKRMTELFQRQSSLSVPPPPPP
jgi:hypothetical protein